MNDHISIDELLSIYELPLRPLMLFKCMKKKRASTFKEGKLYFNTPKTWIDMGNKGNIGQGDALEGVFRCSGNINNAPLHISVDDDIEEFIYKDRYYYRRKRIEDYRCFCLYGLHNKSFQKTIADDGRAKYSFCVPKEYFGEFTDYKTEEEYNRAPDENKPVVVFINNPDAFFERIRNKIISLGVDADNIVISPVRYINKKETFIINENIPNELLYKDADFVKQSEVRVIIKDCSDKIRKYFSDNKGIIDVGSLEDIIEIKDFYYDDLNFEGVGNSGLLYSLSKPLQSNINDMSFTELVQLLLNILV